MTAAGGTQLGLRSSADSGGGDGRLGQSGARWPPPPPQYASGRLQSFCPKRPSAAGSRTGTGVSTWRYRLQTDDDAAAGRHAGATSGGGRSFGTKWLEAAGRISRRRWRPPRIILSQTSIRPRYPRRNASPAACRRPLSSADALDADEASGRRRHFGTNHFERDE